MSIETLKEKASAYNISQEYLDSKEKGRLEFVTKFPIERIQKLTLDEYALGTDKESFSYWLEFKKIDNNIIAFGIGGANAAKFGLYKSKDGEYQKGYGDKKQVLLGKELDDYFNLIKSKITQALKFISEDKTTEIKKLDIPIGNIVLQKILAIYYPNKFITIGSINVLIELAKKLGIKDIELTASNLVEINYLCRKAIDNYEEFKNWPYEKIGRFFWENLDGENKKGNKKDAQKYYLVGAYWDNRTPADRTQSFVENGIWENGYDDKFIDEVNLIPVGSQIAIKSVFTREKTKSVMAIKARGTVLENNNDGKTLVVEWDGNFIPFEVDFSGGYWATIKEVTNKEHINAIFHNTNNKTNAFELVKGKFQPSIFNNYIDLLRKIIIDLKIQPNDQRIVYSVRDNSLNFTVGQRYCFNLYVSENRGVYGVISKTKLSDNSEPYDGTPPQPFYSYFKDFNPTATEWESIIESIKEELSRTTKSGYRKYNNDDFENFVFSTEKTTNHNQMNLPLNTILYGPPGTGKTYNTILRAAEIVENRKIDSYQEALKIFKSNLHDQIEFITFHQNYSYEDFIQGLRPDTENDKELTFERKDGVFKEIADKALKNITASEQSPVAKKSFEETFNEYVNPLVEGEVEQIEVRMKKVSYYITAITNKSIEFRKTSGGTEHTLSISTLKKMYDAESVLDIQGLSSYYSPLLDQLLNIGKDSTLKKENIQRKNYVIIIDEINRANISRVFGELITLIEPDKRSHGVIPLETRLPSGDPFIVPSNLYIIGTMNTADKSIALLDIALRRRFEFESMYPLYNIKGSEIYDKDILLKINEQIIKSKGHDFQIGHAYFMGENKDLIQRMNKKVIPLLLEYFMNDEKEVKAILFNAGLQIEENSWPIKISGKRA
jgi:hypothetical protein